MNLRCALAVLIFSCTLSTDAWALRSIDQAGIVVHYPDAEEAIASELVRKLPGMRSFLEAHGLPVDSTLHIILDERLDAPRVSVAMIPHREIRIPLRAPGVLEEGYLEADPWAYFLFRGLCLQGLYGMRGGLPKLAHGLFGEVISPNLVLPQWLDDGITDLLYCQYSGKEPLDPYNAALYSVSALPDLSRLSNHPGIWPGYFAHRIYGRPFIRWVYERYGWETLRAFMTEHGSGIIPIEIDLKAQRIFGKTWVALWDEFRKAQPERTGAQGGLLIDGFWPAPYKYWNIAGVHPGMDQYRWRGRYGYEDRYGTLWISEYDSDDISVITGYRDGVSIPCPAEHIGDPGTGDIAVGRRGHNPVLVELKTMPARLGMARIRPSETVISAPPGVIALSGPVRNASGTVAVAANSAGNWDIWLYDGTWQRLTDTPSVEMDPWWDEGGLVFSSNASGVFQVCAADMQPLTASTHAALMPRSSHYLELGQDGWLKNGYVPPEVAAAPALPIAPLSLSETLPLPSLSYTPWSSITPNYLVPDIYLGESDLQLGLATWSRDVTKEYTTDAGFRYSFHDDYLSLRLGGRAKYIGLQGSRYPLSYRSNHGDTFESRMEAKLYCIPFLHDPELLEFSINRLDYEPTEGQGESARDVWGALQVHKEYGNLFTWGTFETYSGGRQSLFGGIRLRWGRDIYGIMQVQAGKTWHGYAPGHGSFRIGGDTGEGYFTQRPSRLFPLRGFSSNQLEAGQALTSGIELYWPLVNIQRGYETLPLFLHKLRLGTFLDTGACRDHINRDDMLMGAGIELITFMELAWGYLSDFRMGIAWPVHQPDYLNQHGPVFLLQIGRPL